MIIKDLTIGYTQPVIQNISLKLNPGSFVCLVGRNGTGKSTLLKTLSGIISPIHGEITLDNRTLQEYTPAEISKRIGLVLTQVPDLPNTSLREFVAYGRLPYTSWLGKLRMEDWAVADSAIKRLEIEDLALRPMRELSDGERQKSLIARSIAQGTEYLLLDEPSAFLDYESKQELMSLLARLAHTEKKAILLSTHDLELAYHHADLIWKIQNASIEEHTPDYFK